MIKDHSKMLKQKSSFNAWKKKGAFLKLCEERKEQFTNNIKDFKFQTSGIFYAEAFAFLVFCEMFDIDIVLESGMARGNSTELWARNFKGKIITFENDKKKYHDSVVERLAKYKNIEINFQNSFEGFKNKIYQFKNKRIALFIDGPKDQEAVMLALNSFKNKNVIFAGVHDVANPITKCRPNYGFMSKFSFHLLSTDEAEFRDQYAYLDDSISDPEGGAFIYNEQGIPFESFDPKAILKRFPQGPGIGIAINPRGEIF